MRLKHNYKLWNGLECKKNYTYPMKTKVMTFKYLEQLENKHKIKMQHLFYPLTEPKVAGILIRTWNRKV